jgi:hypothetical protein
MMRCLHLAIDAPSKPGVRVLNAAAQHATVPEGASVAEILRGWWCLPNTGLFDQSRST